ncbi:MAG: hypothetical protein FWB73_04815 [Treponema sp.]|nr:hypothetical protein [Treponema sp.]
MKKKNCFWMICLLAITAIAITLGSCGGDPNNESSGEDFDIVGTYTYSQPLPQSGGTLVYTWVFNSNKTYKITRSIGSSENTGNWSVKGKEITLTDTSSQSMGMVPAETFSISSSGNQVTLNYKGSSVSLIFTIQLTTTGNSVTLTRKSTGLVRQVSAGSLHTVAIKTDGTLWAWGDNRYGQLGDGTSGIDSNDHSANKNIPVLIGSGYASVSAGDSHTVAIKTDGTLWAWGANSSGQLGDGTWYESKNTPVQIGTGYASVSAGDDHTVAIKTDGTLWAWGMNNYGQLGDGTNTYYNDGYGNYINNDRNAPVQIGTGYASVSAGSDHTVAIKTDGSLWAWGRNNYGQLGDGTNGYLDENNNYINNNKNTPVQIGNGYASVSAGDNYTVAIKTDGSLWAWGWNYNGELGDGTNVHKNTPVQIGNGYSTLSASNHTVAIKTDGSLWAWGWNYGQQLGDGTNVDKNTPVQIGQDKWTSVSTGSMYTVAIKTDGSLWAWGRNSYGQLGLGDSGDATGRNTPTQVFIE